MLCETKLPRAVIDQDTDHSKLALKAVLVDRKHLKDSLTLGFTASWGSKLHLRDMILPHYSVETLLSHIAQVHPMISFLSDDSPTDLTELITLVMDGKAMKVNLQVREYMTPTVTGKDLYPNKITIKVKGLSPPTMAVKERNALADSCKRAKFQIRGKNMLELPCVYEVDSKCGRGHFGVPIVARNGGKNQPRYALLQPPIEEVTTTHNGVKYVHTNLVVLWAVKCHRNRVKVMTRFQDNPKNPYMSYLEDIRVYQESDTRTPDLTVLGGKKWKCGYVNDGFNASLQGKPAPCRSWTECAESVSLTTNDCGDFQMHTDTDSYQ